MQGYKLSILFMRFAKGAAKRTLAHTLSILFMRFPRRPQLPDRGGYFQFSLWDSSTYAVTSLGPTNPFNSLYEIPQYRRQLNRYSGAFNSLYEIRHHLPEGRRTSQEAFNSLYEIQAPVWTLRPPSSHPFQFSLWDSGSIKTRMC